MSDDKERTVINKVIGTCPVCGYKIFESNQFIKADRKIFHQHCIPGATLKAALELGDLMRELIEKIEGLDTHNSKT